MNAGIGMESLDEHEDVAEVRRGPGRPRRQHSRDASDERGGAERGTQEREFEEREFSDDEALELFRDSLEQSVLPDLPPMPGYHVCWLTTSNPRDTIQRRIQIGYELITVDTLPGWDGVRVKTGDYAGVVGINEMLAARIPLGRYNKFMREVHHSRPLNEELKLRSMADDLKNGARQRGLQVEEGDGTADLGQRVAPMPEFTH
jgi:hypothetical protein